MSDPTIVVAGGLAQRGGHGGHAWVFLQYLLGFRRMGFDVLFVDRLETGWDEHSDGGDVARCIEALRHTLGWASPPIEYAVLIDGGRRVIGMPRDQLLARLRDSVMLLNIMGFLDDPELRDLAPLRVFLDIDPGFPQMWHALGLADVLVGHDAHATVGANIGRPDCGVPTCGIEWLATRPPVVLDSWPIASDHGRAITTVASWRGPFAPIRYEAQDYGLRVHEFRQFATLPGCVAVPFDFELALDIDPADDSDRRRLEHEQWRLVDPKVVARDANTYRSYIQGSSAEFMVAKGMYVRSRSGWFSDRSACYLASGRPVVAQDTGLSHLYPDGCGLLTFATLDEAAGCVEALATDHARHARGARRLAEEYFDSDRVLSGLLDSLQVHPRPAT